MPAGPFNSDFRVLVIMFKDGGEDSMHRFRPRNTARLAEIRTHRPTLGFTDAEVAANTGGNLNADWNLHPSLNPLKAIYDAGQMAVVHRVGNMFTNLNPFTIQQIRATTRTTNAHGIVLPLGIGGHDWQQVGAASMIPRDFTDQFGAPRSIKESGFVGRLMVNFAPFVHSFGTPSAPPAPLPLMYQAGFGGSAIGLMHRSGLTRALELPQSGRFSRNLNGSAVNTQAAALARLDAIMALPQTEMRRQVFQNVTNTMRQAVGFFQPVCEGGNTTFPITDAAFNPQPEGGWRAVLRQVSRAIEQRLGAPLGTPAGFGLGRRVVFLCNMGDYDTHSAQGKTSGRLPILFNDEALALVSFQNAMINLGMWNNVVVADYSEFSRTLTENGAAGTDHAWAREATVMGGAVIGGMYGTPPTAYGVTSYNPDGSIITPGGSHDINGGEAGGGSLAPALSQEQYWGRILEWFGADATDLTAALPRRAVFGAPVPLI